MIVFKVYKLLILQVMLFNGRVFCREIIRSQTTQTELPCSTIEKDPPLNSGIAGDNFRWKNGFFVQIDPKFEPESIEYRNISGALMELSKFICIKIRVWRQNRAPTGAYSFIQRGDPNSGCWSEVGKQGAKQIVNLQTPGCTSKGIILHELMHALGFYHEQSRADRDQYVKVFEENIEDGYYKNNFPIVSSSIHFDLPYDYYSIMHYKSFAFSKNRKPTILKINGEKVGGNGKLTSNDIIKLKRMYCNSGSKKKLNFLRIFKKRISTGNSGI